MIKYSWTPEFELAAQQDIIRRDSQIHIKDLIHKYQELEVGHFVQDTFNGKFIDIAVDIGGGCLGGALSIFKGAKQCILVDKLAEEYNTLGGLPNHIKPTACDFDRLDIESNSADIVFAWDVFDHAQDMDHCLRGFAEVVRILKQGGLFFLTFPLRYEAREGHPICVNIQQIRSMLTDFEVLKESGMGKPTYYDFIYLFSGKKI